MAYPDGHRAWLEDLERHRAEYGLELAELVAGLPPREPPAVGSFTFTLFLPFTEGIDDGSTDSPGARGAERFTDTDH